eukprot:363442-Chlamydomonas_euryale.AAC.5
MFVKESGVRTRRTSSPLRSRNGGPRANKQRPRLARPARGICNGSKRVFRPTAPPASRCRRLLCQSSFGAAAAISKMVCNGSAAPPLPPLHPGPPGCMSRSMLPD